MQWACGEPCHFGHLLVFSRTYTLLNEEGEAPSMSPQQQKRRKDASTPSGARVFPFHHEDTYSIYRRYNTLCPRFVQHVDIELYSKGCFSFFDVFFIQYTSSRKIIVWARAGWSPHAIRCTKAL